MNRLYHKFFIWKNRNLKETQIVLIAAFLIGILTALAALILKTLIHTIQNFLTHNFTTSNANFLYLIYPIIGILIAGLFVKYIVKDDISHGVTRILYAISRKKSYLKLHNTYTSIIASSITIGFGGSVGAEAPIVLTGSAIGSNLGRFFKLEKKYLMVLIGCGAAGAIAGIFKAPIAGLLFVVEVLLLDLTTFTILPLLVTAVTATTVSYITMGRTAMFEYHQIAVFEMDRIPYVILLGIFCGLVSLYFTRAMSATETFFSKFNHLKKFGLAAVILSVLIFLLPPLYGEGYDLINALINTSAPQEIILDNSLFYESRDQQWTLILFLIAIMLTKVFASSATNAGGGTGGIFAPSLFLGAVAGYVFANTFNKINEGKLFSIVLPESNFALMGMAAIMAGVMHAPLTGTFLILELTGGYNLFLPIMIASVTSYATIRIFESHSIYSMRLAKKGDLLTHHKDQAVLTLMNKKDLIETNFIALNINMTLGDMVHDVISRSSRNVFPIIDNDGKYMGIVLIDNIRSIMFRPELYRKFKVSDLMTTAPALLNTQMGMKQIMDIFDTTKAWNLPIVDENNMYLGFISKSVILDAYRDVLADNFVEE